MHETFLSLLRCPSCRRGAFGHRVTRAAVIPGRAGNKQERDIVEGQICCSVCGAEAPIRSGVLRMCELNQATAIQVDEQTRESFGLEWDLHRPKDGTWGMTLEERTKWYFLAGVGLSPEEVVGLTVLDAGCGNGSSTLGIARLGATALGMDLSTGLEKAVEYFEPTDRSLALSYVQGNLMDAPFAPASFDIIFSAGVLHHTPDTRQAFLALAPLVKPNGRFYVWLYHREPVVTAVVNAIRFFTTRLPPRAFSRIAWRTAPAFRLFTRLTNALGLRRYRPMSRDAAALALLDIFGARYAHAHTHEEVDGWYEAAGFEKPARVSQERRGFGVCGRKRG